MDRYHVLENFYMCKEAGNLVRSAGMTLHAPSSLYAGAGLSGAGGAYLGTVPNKNALKRLSKEYGLSPEETQELLRERPVGAMHGFGAGLSGSVAGAMIGGTLGRKAGADVGSVLGGALGMGYVSDANQKKYRKRAKLLAERRKRRNKS